MIWYWIKNRLLRPLTHRKVTYTGWEAARRKFFVLNPQENITLQGTTEIVAWQDGHRVPVMQLRDLEHSIVTVYSNYDLPLYIGVEQDPTLTIWEARR